MEFPHSHGLVGSISQVSPIGSGVNLHLESNEFAQRFTPNMQNKQRKKISKNKLDNSSSIEFLNNYNIFSQYLFNKVNYNNNNCNIIILPEDRYFGKGCEDCE